MTVVQQYQLGDCIGKGAFGTVFRGLSLESGKVVAVKQIPLRNVAASTRPAERDRPPGRPRAGSVSTFAAQTIDTCLAEVAILKKLRHDNVVRYLGFVRTTDHVYQILEYCENGSLRSIYKRFGRFPEHLVGVYLGQILAGLAYLHDQGVIHRDIKGANILSTKTGQIKLTDFGVSTLVGDDDAHSVGSPYWMAPEVVELHGVTTAADIWSLGCTVLELLQGEPPYGQLSTMAALFRMVQDPHPPFPTPTSPTVQHFLRQCFPKAPHQRATARELLDHSWIRRCTRSDSRSDTVREGTASHTSFQEAIRTVQQWNDALSRPVTTPASAGPDPLETNKHNIARYRSPDSKGDSWDHDFDDLTNLTPSNLRPTDRVLDLALSPSFASMSDPADSVTVPTTSPTSRGSNHSAVWPASLGSVGPLSPTASIRPASPSSLVAPGHPATNLSHTFRANARPRPPDPPARDNWDADYDIPESDLRNRLDLAESRQPLRRTNTGQSFSSQHDGSMSSTLYHGDHHQPSFAVAAADAAFNHRSSTLVVDPHRPASANGSSTRSASSDKSTDPLAAYAPFISPTSSGPPTATSISTSDAVTSLANTGLSFPSASSRGFSGGSRPRAGRQVSFSFYTDGSDDRALRTTESPAARDGEVVVPDSLLLSNQRLDQVRRERARARAQSMSALPRPTLRPPDLGISTPACGASPCDSAVDAVDLAVSANSEAAGVSPALEQLEKTMAALGDPIGTPTTIIQGSHTLATLVAHNPNARIAFTDGTHLLTLLGLLDRITDPEARGAVVGLLNLLADNQPAVHALICQSGGVATLLRVLGDSTRMGNETAGDATDITRRELLLETAYFCKLLCVGEEAGEGSRSAFAAAGGLAAVVHLLRTDAFSTDQCELVWVTIDIMAALVDSADPAARDLTVRTLVYHGVLEPLAHAFYRFAALQREAHYLHKMAGLLLTLARTTSTGVPPAGSRDDPARTAWLTPAVVKRVVKTMRALPPATLLAILRALEALGPAAPVPDRLADTKLLEILTTFLRTDFGRLTSKIVHLVSILLFRLCHLDADRRHRAVRAGAVPMWIQIGRVSRTLRPYTLPLLYELAHAPVTSAGGPDLPTDGVAQFHELLWEHGAWTLYVQLLTDPEWAVPALEALVALAQLAPMRAENALLADCKGDDGVSSVVNLCTRLCPDHPDYDRLVAALLKFVRVPWRVTRNLACYVSLTPKSSSPTQFPDAPLLPQVLLARAHQASSISQINLLKSLRVLLDPRLAAPSAPLLGWVHRELAQLKAQSSAIMVQTSCQGLLEWLRTVSPTL
ncbi:Protein kinase of the Mitotic Exit Network [Tieghemiomyces parasiticus]|uniref:Protein kinase of the Mitotic Exit Network n=1 Tax=Tieghemiomyces parasiticus TaxID=78921 RepID=A0A9W7ZZM8_9FUNG|nr:Protein kinase of the Mitotic Exit Network [Tieghemiomyces parasiticus]